MILLCYFKNKTTPLLISCLPTTTPKEESNQQPIEYRKLFFPVLINQIHERTVKISYFSLLELEPYVIYENMQLNQALFLLAKNIDF